MRSAGPRSLTWLHSRPPGYAHAVLASLQRGAVTPSRAVELMRGQVSLADLPADDEADDEPYLTLVLSLLPWCSTRQLGERVSARHD